MRSASSLCFVLAMAIQPKLALPLQADVRAHQIVLKVGEEAELDDGRLRLRFERVLADSRCPRGARCIPGWRGEGGGLGPGGFRAGSLAYCCWSGACFFSGIQELLGTDEISQSVPGTRTKENVRSTYSRCSCRKQTIYRGCQTSGLLSEGVKGNDDLILPRVVS